MEEKKKINPVIIILLILLIGLSTYVVYDKFFKVNSTKESEKEKANTEEKTTYKDYQEKTGPENEYTVYYKFTTNDNYISKVPVKDLSSLLIDMGSEYFTMKYVVLNEGKVYYYFENGVNKEEYITRYFDLIDPSYTHNDNNIKLNELSELSGKVKRVKSANMTSGMDVSQLLIMEDGSVYSLSLNINNEPTLLKMDELSKYKVDDIISWHTSSDGADYKVVFTDGTILEKSYRLI